MLEDDLVDSCKPGGRISVVGIYKGMPPRASGVMTGVLKAVVVANSVRQLMREVDRDLSADDIRYALQRAAMLWWSAVDLDHDVYDPSTSVMHVNCQNAMRQHMSLSFPSFKLAGSGWLSLEGRRAYKLLRVLHARCFAVSFTCCLLLTVTKDLCDTCLSAALSRHQILRSVSSHVPK